MPPRFLRAFTGYRGVHPVPVQRHPPQHGLREPLEHDLGLAQVRLDPPLFAQPGRSYRELAKWQ